MEGHELPLSLVVDQTTPTCMKQSVRTCAWRNVSKPSFFDKGAPILFVFSRKSSRYV